MKPLILINFKTYKEAAGNKELKLAKQISLVRSRKYQIAVAPPLLWLKEICDHTTLQVYAQHVDPDTYGAHTGNVLPQEVKKVGAVGTLLNHSEKKLPFWKLKKTVAACKEERLTTIVCASTLLEIKKVAKFHPDYIAYEPAALIGGDVSVTSANPEVIVKAVKLVKRISPKTKVLCGAGIHNKGDILQALLLGTQGVLIGHAVPKARDPKKFLKEMLEN
jgi:triosephosphate isomerase (TIM)